MANYLDDNSITYKPISKEQNYHFNIKAWKLSV